MDPELSAIKTYRYLRLAMVTVSFTLLCAVAIEHLRTQPSCWQTSISAYYYTPAQSIFVGGLITIGVCMIALKASTEWEDITLNIGGMLAPVVAVVPTPGAGSCWSVPVQAHDPSPNIVNNISSLLITGAAMFGVALAIALKSGRDGRTGKDGAADRRNLHYRIGFVVAGLLLLGCTGWLLVDRAGFEAEAHYTAAILLFVCLVGVTCLNAWGLGTKRGGSRRSKRPYANRYALIAVLMIAATVGIVGWTMLVGWAHGLLWLETILLLLFASFWLTQTQELWRPGLRDHTRPDNAVS